jgi:hypothetical protein
MRPGVIKAETVLNIEAQEYKSATQVKPHRIFQLGSYGALWQKRNSIMTKYPAFRRAIKRETKNQI